MARTSVSTNAEGSLASMCPTQSPMISMGAPVAEVLRPCSTPYNACCSCDQERDQATHGIHEYMHTIFMEAMVEMRVFLKW